MGDKKEALEKCLKMWEYIAEHDVGKFDAIEALDLWVSGVVNSYPLFGCWACEYTKNENREAVCSKCPIDEWRNETGDEINNFRCEQCDEEYESPYALWTSTLPFGDSADTKEHALEVIKLIKQSLENLDENKTDE